VLTLRRDKNYPRAINWRWGDRLLFTSAPQYILFPIAYRKNRRAFAGVYLGYCGKLWGIGVRHSFYSFGKLHRAITRLVREWKKLNESS
jgi:hypothetical protein